MLIQQVTLIVDDYDLAIAFFVDRARLRVGRGLTVDDQRWPTQTMGRRQATRRRDGTALAQADGDEQAAAIGHQTAGRVGFFLRVDDFDAAYERLAAHDVEFVGDVRSEPFVRVTVFVDIAGNRWDLLGPP